MTRHTLGIIAQLYNLKVIWPLHYHYSTIVVMIQISDTISTPKHFVKHLINFVSFNLIFNQTKKTYILLFAKDCDFLLLIRAIKDPNIPIHDTIHYLREVFFSLFHCYLPCFPIDNLVQFCWEPEKSFVFVAVALVYRFAYLCLVM